jgi:hypothetical protein
VSDFDNFDDLDAVRDFRSLTNPYPGSVDRAVRRRIVERAAERGQGSGAPERRSPHPPDGGSLWGLPVGRPGGTAAVAERRAPGPVRRRPHPCMVAVSLALALTLTVGVLVRRGTPSDSAQLGGIERVGHVEPSAALGVRAWRELVAGQADDALGDGLYAYRKIERGLPGGLMVDGAPVETGAVRQVQERWAAPTRPGRLVVTTDRPSAEDGDPDPDAGTGTGARPVRSEVLPAGEAFDGRSYDQLRGLPSEGPLLAARLEALTGEPAGDWDGTVASVLGMLIEPVVRPEVRAGLVELLAVRGLVAIGTVTDRAGRPGSGFVVADGAWRWTVVVDSATGRVRAWEVRRAGAAVPDSYVVVLAAEIVTEAGAS